VVAGKTASSTPSYFASR
jgi:hypothetical protein